MDFPSEFAAAEDNFTLEVTTIYVKYVRSTVKPITDKDPKYKETHLIPESYFRIYFQFLFTEYSYRYNVQDKIIDEMIKILH